MIQLPQQASDQQRYPPPRRGPGAPGDGGVVRHRQKGRAGWGERDGGVGCPDVRIDRDHLVVSSSRDEYHSTAWKRACALINSGYVVSQCCVEVQKTFCAIRLS